MKHLLHNSIKIGKIDMTRIRYRKYNTSSITSDVMLVDKDFMYIDIDLLQRTYKIINARCEVVTHGKGNDISHTKKLAKEAIRALGAMFFDEVRRRK